MPTNRITKFTFNGNLDFSSKIMSLDTAKWILSHLSAVNGKTIQFSTDIIDALAFNEEGVDLVKLARRRGWNFLMPNSVRNDIQFKTTDGSTTASFKINGTAYNDQDNVTVTADSDGWFRYNIPYGTTLTTLIGAFNEKTNIDRVVLGEFLDTSNLTDINRMFRYADGVKWIYFNCKFENPLNMTRTFQVRVAGQLLTIGGIDILSGSVTDNTFAISSQTINNISSNIIEESIDLTYCPLNLNSAKVILRALQQVTSETIQFSTTTWGYILADDEAIELLETAYSNGWNSNEPDIQVVAESGYDGVVRLNGANKQLTNISGTEVWYGSAGTVTAMDYFAKHTTYNSSAYYNPTSQYMKSVRFGKNINTTSCTTFAFAFYCNGVSNGLLTKLDVRHLNVSNATNIRNFWADAGGGSNKKIIGLENWNPSKCTNFTNFLTNCRFNHNLDLHNWHIPANATITSMFGALSMDVLYNVNNPKIYYTPGYWATDPMNDSNLAADRRKPTVYPYHDITIAGSTNFSGSLTINMEGASTQYTAQMTRDNTLGIWYYDVPSNISISSLNRMLFRGNDATVRDNVYSLSFAESIRSKLDYEPQVASYFGLFGMVHQCMAMRTVDIDALRGIKAGGANQMFSSNLSGYTSKLCSIYGLEGIIAYYNDVEGNLSGGNYHFISCSSLRYLKLGEWNLVNYLTQCFYGCSNLTRINRFPGVLSGCNTTNAMVSCTALTTIDSSGPISETLSFADCPLNVASAKVILSALQTVTSETLTFSSTTKTAINGDSEALALRNAAVSRGWNIPLN